MNFSTASALVTATALLAACLFAGCKPAADSKSQPSAPAKTNYYYVKGVLKSVKPGGRTAVIEHEEIPNYMPKMTMPFDVAHTNELAGLKPGDQLHFRIVDTTTEAWIDQITKVGVANLGGSPLTNKNFRLVRDVEVLKLGEMMPNYTFTNELGRAVKLADLKGTAYGLTFIFTRCQFPNFCPRISRNFSDAAKALAADKSAPTNWHLFSLSFDVEYDTPLVMQNYAKRHAYDPARWNFLTGALIDVDAITEQFGLTFPRNESGFGFDHNMRTAIVDAHGKVHAVIIGNEWKVDDFVTEMKKAAAK
ncbi:MAG: SCO family protein [Verrucomicrobia bacterium]|nr:SCO family protein [Verrucomicrobiota bacterium]